MGDVYPQPRNNLGILRDSEKLSKRDQSIKHTRHQNQSNITQNETPGTTKKMRVYLAGPMRGYLNDNHQAFDAAEKQWRAAGHNPVSPAYLARALGKGGEGGNYESDARFIRLVMMIDCTVICGCDAIAVLPGWERSRGSTMEVALAQSIGIPIFDAVKMTEITDTVPITPWSGLRYPDWEFLPVPNRS